MILYDVCIYIYIYIYSIHTLYIYIYIYTYIHTYIPYRPCGAPSRVERHGRPGAPAGSRLSWIFAYKIFELRIGRFEVEFDKIFELRIVHTWHILPPSKIDCGLFLADFTDSGGKYLFHRIGWKGRIWQLCISASIIIITIIITITITIVIIVIISIVIVFFMTIIQPVVRLRGGPMVNRFTLSLASPASRRGRDKRGFHRRATNPLRFVLCCFECAHVATCCHMLSHFVTYCHTI